MTDRSTDAVEMVDVFRGGMLECVHRGHAVVMRASGEIVASWGAPDAIILPRSSCKMLQALPLLESGAADAAGLNDEHLALSCASHQGAAMHTQRVAAWLNARGLSESDLRCGTQFPRDRAEADRVRETGEGACQLHNNCSGKHAGFLTLSQHLGGGSEYHQIDHPVQQAIKAAFEDMSGETSPGYGIDGCSAPNHASTLSGLALAVARMADPSGLGAARESAARRLVGAMKKYPLLVAGETRACSEMMAAMPGHAVVKTGAEGVFVAILPELGMGVALKIEDGATRASEAATAAILSRLGVADSNHPNIAKRLNPVQKNWNKVVTGQIQPSETLWNRGQRIL